jgi:hypothetical protein
MAQCEEEEGDCPRGMKLLSEHDIVYIDFCTGELESQAFCVRFHS